MQFSSCVNVTDSWSNPSQVGIYYCCGSSTLVVVVVVVVVVV